MEIIANHGSLLIMVAAFFGLLMAIGIGANDVANAMGTSVGARAVTIRQAIVIAMIFEFAGAYLAGGEVTQTIRSGIIDTNAFAGHPQTLVFGMMASLLAAGIWLIVASLMGWPVSTTHSIIGAIIGFACVSVGPEAVEWGGVKGIVGSWIITPLISGVVAYGIFLSAQRLIFNTENPFANARRFGPVYMFLTALVISLVTIKKGLKHVGLHLTDGETWLISLLVSLLVMLGGYLYLSRKSFTDDADEQDHFRGVERVFSLLMVITACAMAFAHGSNDVANAIGPLSAIVAIVREPSVLAGTSPIVWWILPLGGIGIVVGLALMGRRVMETVGTGITDLTPSRGFAAQFATASTVVIASGTGLPISTTQTLVGAVLGVGFARGIAALNLNVVRNIVASWIVTLPAGAALSIALFYLLQAIFG
ncbi:MULTISPECIES: inorganic phosphate transporter [Edwardsiella]|uniref:Phosphate transporter n=2 Tax=Edwardsiella anguillarum TaxID=1821960 RepID=A0A076LQ00_9GAMM|nr:MULTISPECIES: inorganic phosphate transporter [Edwardsiella]AKM46020.1 phosphate permease [Edwardsiella sp. EA181011]GAJ67030.1 Pho4 family protein [Edwardsiella piscicida]AIJ08668.1 putative low-affinity inorganic phosphate transporter [Edwardsiella anguillarum ET080813]AKR76703.1 inorganic phosphate transporter [Edwardsiella sp. LADL05-105]KAB0592889.1 inorganic phosphate transporter [Edwardsiella anguillarum]